MERLTEKRDGQNVIPLRQDGKTKWSLCSAGMGDAPTQFLYGDHADRLAEYEGLEEQGKLLKLPCAVGDIIYEVSYENREFVIKEHIVKEFVYRKYRFSRIEIYCENENGFLVCNSMGKLDECLFLTKSAAEQALKEMEGKSD